MRIEDDAFNAGWNAALNEALRRVKELPQEGIADDGIRVLIGKPEVLNILRDCE